jgi:hypothetical protein
MATTKTPTKNTKAKTSKAPSTSKAKTASNGTKASGSRSKAAAGSRSKASTSRPKASGSRSKNGAPAAQRSSGNGSSSHGLVDELKSARDTVEDVGKTAASTAGKAVSKAKVPLIASGAALAGVAGGLALNSTRSKGTKVLGMKMPKTKVKIRSKDLVKAADRVAGAGEQIGRVSTGFRELQGTSDADHGNGHHRSPLEVVIESLTRRH